MFNLPQDILDVLPADPFQQLDVARKITSIAISTRVASLESECAGLRRQLAGRDSVIVDLNSQLNSVDFALSQNLHKLSVSEQEKENLMKENAVLLESVNKLKRDVAKLESFRKTLMMSLQDEEESTEMSRAAAAASVQNRSSIPSQTYSGESIRSRSFEIGNSYYDEIVKDAYRPRISPSLLAASQTSTLRLTPPTSPPTLSTSASPIRSPNAVSPRRHSISVPSSAFSSVNSSPYSSMSGLTRVDGKEFFRQVRSRLSYEQFSAFLAHVKELNSQKQSNEDTLMAADEIFGPENKDLYAIFEGLITRNFN